MKTNQNRGISLIVLVITIIIMIILAGAIILALNSSNIIGRAEEARTLSDDASKRQIANVALGEFMLKQQENPNITETAEEYVMGKLEAQKINTDNVAIVDNKVIVGSGASFIKQERASVNPLKIGDYVEYTPDVRTSTKYKIGAWDENYEWQEGESFATEADIKWRYIGVDKNGNALLLSDKVTTGILHLEGTEGYLQGPTKLNDLCKELYSSGKGEARSVNVEDVNKVLGAKPKEFFWDEDYIKVYLPSPKTIGQIMAEYNQPGVGWTETPDGKDIKNYLVNYYYYEGSTTPKGQDINSEEYKLIFRNITNTGNISYWLSSSCVDADFNSGYAYFNVRCVSDSYVDTARMFYSDGDSYDRYLPVRPIVSLKSNVQIGDKEGEVWKLK